MHDETIPARRTFFTAWLETLSPAFLAELDRSLLEIRSFDELAPRDVEGIDRLRKGIAECQRG